MSCQIELYANALSEVLGRPVEVNAENQIVTIIDDRQRLELSLSDDRERVHITTPIEGAHDGLPNKVLNTLLEKNYPNDATAGALLRRRANKDFLEMVNVVPVAAMRPDDVAKLASNQAARAIALSDSLEVKVRARMAL